MLSKIYIAVGALLLVGYMGWSLLGWEFGSNRRDPVPTARRPSSSSSSSGYRRSRPSGVFFGGGGFGK